jgi:hypothetical protein
MSYVSRRGRRPNEYASKSSHTYIINEDSVKEFIKKCDLPKKSEEVEMSNKQLVELPSINSNPIKFIIAIDGGYTQAFVRREFPSCTISFFQFGALVFKVNDLEDIGKKPFIEPDDISKLKQIQRLKFVLPTKNITLREESSLVNSVRKSLFEFFKKEPRGDEEVEKFIDTVKWFIYQEYNHSNSVSQWNLASCPNCGRSNICLDKKDIKDYKFKCSCGSDIYLTDVFRLHEAMDNELGAGGILGYLTNLFEQIILIHLIRVILRIRPTLLNEILFIKDGPLAFFGQTANMHRPMRNLINYLFKHHNIFLSGLEKTGAFVEHADEISRKLKPGQVLLINNEYIYKYILPGKADPNNPYGSTTYYGNKLIFKSNDDRIYVVTLPTTDILPNPEKGDFKNIDYILHNIEKLKCDMYDCSLVPIALVNKLVSLSNHPSTAILEKFARHSIR